MNLKATCLLAALALTGCTGWPDEGGGGLAERRATEDTRLLVLKERFERLRRDGAAYLAAGLVHETDTLFVRAQRNNSAAFQDDFEIDLTAIAERLAAIDTKLGKVR